MNPSVINWEAEHRQTLLQSRSALERSNQSVVRSQAVARESEQIGTEVITELGGQRESLLRAKERLSQTDQDLDRTKKIMRTMKRRVLQNKFVLIIIIILEITILGIIIYMRFFKK
ncbi:vesicle transport through interaction with t-SNAREs homolog 1B [Leptopilina boulardi]|uniref:vesicle transport through interaction with t-SNAREs homolog 1B n=1 Tax=Leptopilina boulardi TaxID=63433 RepID=UPI0021F504CF|nr:vesicle transport through interaction with t-SNAREs homolog 1B [Leptopilina boulardi]